ncbi:MAG: TIGR03885 family FMN-dependent LLM class oxidoreductase [Lysobacter sp.]|nr:TIGR03885 family FMN-dependent LLM class oxidoreductase [Lysobacter sp.]
MRAPSTLIGYHASHEQFPPGELLALVQQAERAGFTAAMCSDHFHPWNEAQGQSGHAWTWLGSAMATTKVPFAAVNAPVGRYHPAVIAQAVATLCVMHDDRFTLIAGSGEALNEAMTGRRWPAKAERNRRLRAAVEAMRVLWRGEEIKQTEPGVGFRIEQAKLYTRPARMPKVFIAALSEETARWAAGWADGLATVSMPDHKHHEVLKAFRESGGEGKPAWVQVKLSYDEDDAVALAGACEQWRTNVLAGEISEELRTPRQFEDAARTVTADDMRRTVRVSADLDEHIAWLRADRDAGFDALMLHNVNRSQARFIEDFGHRVIPAMEER